MNTTLDLSYRDGTLFVPVRGEVTTLDITECMKMALGLTENLPAICAHLTQAYGDQYGLRLAFTLDDGACLNEQTFFNRMAQEHAGEEMLWTYVRYLGAFQAYHRERFGHVRWYDEEIVAGLLAAEALATRRRDGIPHFTAFMRAVAEDHCPRFQETILRLVEGFGWSVETVDLAAEYASAPYGVNGDELAALCHERFRLGEALAANPVFFERYLLAGARHLAEQRLGHDDQVYLEIVLDGFPTPALRERAAARLGALVEHPCEPGDRE